MTVQAGRLMLIQLEDTPGGGEFTAIAGLRSTTFALSGESVDVTNSDSVGRARELAAFGTKSCDVSGAGTLTSGGTVAALVALHNGDEIANFRVSVPGIGVFEGPFMLSSLSIGGEHNAEVTIDLSLASAGPYAFTAAS